MKEPRTSGRAGKMDQDGRCPGAFPATPSARRNLSIWGKEMSYEKSTLKPQNSKVSFLRSWGKKRKPWPWRRIWIYLERISRKMKAHKRKAIKWIFGYQSPGKWGKSRKRKGLTTNISDITLILISRTQKGGIVGVKEHSNNTIKRG